MRKSQLIFFVSILFSSSCEEGRKGNLENVALEDFIFEAELIGKDCKFVGMNSDEKLPCAATSNPYVTGDKEFVSCFSTAVFSDTILAQNVERALFSVYKSETEVGVFGFETINEKEAKEIAEQIRIENNKVDGFVLVKENLVIWVWRDGPPCGCYYFIKGFSSVLDPSLDMLEEN